MCGEREGEEGVFSHQTGKNHSTLLESPQIDTIGASLKGG